MDKALRCDCGFEARADDEQELVRCVERHARNAHGMKLAHEQVLALLLRSELDGDVAHKVAARSGRAMRRRGRCE